MLGTVSGNSGAAGLNYQAGASPLIQGATADQANQLYGQAQSGIAQQQAFVNALQGQGAQGMGSQTALSNMLMNQAQGGGPNPAQAMLNQATSANVQNQAALMAGQRGASQNVGLMARQAGQQGMQAQQQAAGQAASMQAQQSLAAQQQLQSLAGTQVSQQGGSLSNLNQQTQNEQSNVLGAIGQLNNASVGSMSSQNSANSGIAGIQAKNQSDMFGGLAQGLGNGLMAMGATGGQITADQGFVKGKGYAQGGPVQNYASGTPDAPVADASTQSASVPQQSFVQKIMAPKQSSNNNSQGQQAPAQKANMSAVQGGGNAVGMAAGKGLKSLFTPSDNSVVNNATPMSTAPIASQADSSMSDVTTPQSMPSSLTDASNSGAFSDIGDAMAFGAQGGLSSLLPLAMLAMAKGGKVPAMLSPGEVYLEPEQAKKVAKGKADPIKTGRHIPGKAKVKGDSLKNDTVRTTLDAGGVVIPRSVLQSKTPHKDAYKFVNAIISKHKMSK